MSRILSKSMKRKSKKGVSWAQSGRNQKLISQAKSLEKELAELC
ncbi:hypothetical protein [endosymbiont GvMRE of Glomus versiforme]|nr:hypothetical protein [endosymbiont GvMRE of Glomus versiforme]RHZ35899.1 hypothetical protein GvMRE_Ic4g120 [endosymbiont GvMRE of Glomus versiforme]